MKPKANHLFTVFLLSVFVLVTRPLSAAELGLDHFKVYDVKPLSVRAEIATKGQFDTDSIGAKVYRLFRFANPVSKNQEPMVDKSAHLSWYLMREATPAVPRGVKFENQFGTQKIVIGPAAALLAPAEKHERGSAFPKRLDHYKCYHVYEGRPVGRSVTLRDQFGVERNRVYMPRYFCAPVMKKHGKQVFKIQNEKAHLVFYDIRPTPHELKRKITDQFGSPGLYFMNSVLLGVPSLKLGFEKL